MSHTKTMLPKFAELNELAAISNGGTILFSTDDWFAVAENMLLDTQPVFIADKYTECGKWMDGWETRRKRIPGHDWCIVKLGAPCVVHGIMVDTAHFTGNFAPKVSIQGARLSQLESRSFPKRNGSLGSACTAEELRQIAKNRTHLWPELVPMTQMQAGYEETRHNYVPVSVDADDQVVSHIRVNIYPDGGIARLRVYGVVHSVADELNDEQQIDLVAMLNGGTCVGYSNAHYGHPRNLIRPGRGVNMGDGWETMRRMDRPAILTADRWGMLAVPGNEWAVMKLCCLGQVDQVVVDTQHFKGNYPDSVKVDIARLGDGDTLTSAQWRPLLASQKLMPNREHFFRDELVETVGTHVRITMAPDGGMSRVRIFGRRATQAH